MRIRKRYISLAIAICLVMGCIFLWLDVSYRNRLTNDLVAYDYLANYHCWYGVFSTTVYTLRESECGKSKEHPYFGVTYCGIRAVPMRTMAVDPKIVPLGSVLVDTQNGRVYIAEDTGNEIKGYRVDLFLGQGTQENLKAASKFGSQRRMYMVIENVFKRR